MPFSGKKLAVVMAVLGVSACGLSATPLATKVIVDQLPTDVIFGAGQPSPAPAPVVAQLPGLGLSQPDLGFFTGSAFPTEPYTTCATAPATAFPAEPATSDVTTKPAVGAYNWVGSGTFDYTPIPTLTVHPPVQPLFQVIVRNVQTFNDTAQSLPGSTQGLNFTYDTVMPQLGSVRGGYWVFHWQVKASPQAGDPEGGLVLKSITALDGKRSNPTPVFDSKNGPGLLLLPLPAEPGTVGVQTPNGGQGPTVSVDLSGNNNTMEFSGSVGARERVDACGTWLQAWPVDGTLQSGAGSATIHLDVATQMGALLLVFNIKDDGTFLGTTFHKLGTHVGQTSAGPLPKEWQP